MIGKPLSPLTARVLGCAQAAALVLAGWWAFQPALHGGWLWRDRAFLAESGPVRDSAGLWKMWLAPQAPDYRPVRTSVQWAQWRLFGDDPSGYHLTNLGLHLLGALLLWRVLNKLAAALDPSTSPGPVGRLGATPPISTGWVAALIFAVHPLALQSAARIPGLGAVLALPLLLLALLAWLAWDVPQAASPAASPPAGRRPALLFPISALLCFALAMLSDPSAALFPAVLLLHAWWKRGRISRADWRAIEPFVAILLLFAVMVACLRSYSTEEATTAGLPARLGAAIAAGASYLFHCVLPVGLNPVHPTGYVALAFLIGAGAAAAGALIRSASRRSRAIAAGAAAAAVLALAAASRGEAREFVDDGAFWGAAADRDPGSAEAQYHLGLVLVGARQLPEAIGRFEEALRLKPSYAEAQSDLAIALCAENRPADAIPHFERAVELDGDNAQIRYNFGLALRAVGRPGDARAQWQAAARLLRGDSADAR